MKPKIILASASPRRKELLSQLVSEFAIIPSNIKEKYPSDLDVFKVALHISNLKALDVYKNNTDSLVIGCDTIVILNNEILGKPKNKEDARRMLNLLSDKMHYVVSGLTVYYSNKKYEINSINKVYFKKLSKEEIDLYLKNSEYKDKAGSYAIQGLASKFIDKFEGEYESIVGLPINELSNLLNSIIK